MTEEKNVPYNATDTFFFGTESKTSLTAANSWLKETQYSVSFCIYLHVAAVAFEMQRTIAVGPANERGEEEVKPCLQHHPDANHCLVLLFALESAVSFSHGMCPDLGWAPHSCKEPAFQSDQPDPDQFGSSSVWSRRARLCSWTKQREFYQFMNQTGNESIQCVCACEIKLWRCCIHKPLKRGIWNLVCLLFSVGFIMSLGWCWCKNGNVLSILIFPCLNLTYLPIDSDPGLKPNQWCIHHFGQEGRWWPTYHPSHVPTL